MTHGKNAFGQSSLPEKKQKDEKRVMALMSDSVHA